MLERCYFRRIFHFKRFESVRCLQVNFGTLDFQHLQCVRKKETKMFLGISQTNLGRFSWNLIYGFLNKFAIKWCKHFSPHLNSVSTLPCKTWNAHCARAYHWGDTERNSRIYPTATVDSIFARFESSWLQSVRNIAREDVKIRITNLHELKQRLRTESNKLDHVVIVAAIHQRHHR